MHDLKSNYLKIKKQVRLALKDSLDQRDNLHFYPNSPKMSDLEIISLAITAECLEIDSENLLWSKLKKDYSLLFPNLVHRTRFNQRRRGLKDWIVYCADQLADQIPTEEQLYIVDSIPIPVCKLSREKSSKVCRKPTDVVKASKGYFAADKSYFWGFRLHLITSLSGVFQELKILPANVHDIHFLKQLTQSHLYDCKLIGDRAYRSNPLQLSLFEQFQIDLQVPYRINQKEELSVVSCCNSRLAGR